MLHRKLAVSVSILAFCAPAVFAQDAAPQEERKAFDTIIVTSQKRETTAQDISTAATVLGGDALADKAVTRLDDLQTAAPGLSIADAGLTQAVNIRGVGLASGSPNVSNGVATYMDGLFQPPIVTTNSFYDIGGIEVLRGPQGTFVGSNSTGGAIFITSRDPDLGDVNGYAQGELGSDSLFGFEGAVNIPLSDTVAVRLAGISRERDSYYTNLGPTTPGMLDEKAGRIGVLWVPTDKFESLLKVEHAEKSTGGYAFRPREDALYGPYRSNDIRTLTYDDQTANDETATQVSLKLDYTFDNGISVRSITGYQDKKIENLWDLDGTSAPNLPRRTQNQFVQEKVSTQEFNVLSPDDGRFTWIVGAYYQKNEILIDIENRSDGFPTNIAGTNEKVTRGIFAHTTFDLTDTLELETGIRYSDFDITGEGAVRIGAGIPGFPGDGLTVADIGGDHDDGEPTGKIGLNWKPSADHLIYGFAARGYKPGGFASRTDEFRPEIVVDYEAGWKGSFADGRVNTQVGAFYYDYTDFQIDTLNPTSGRSAPDNLTDATVAGVEGQIQARFGGFAFDGGIAYVDSSLDDAQFVDARAVARAFPGINTAPQCPAGQPSAPPTCLDYTPFLTNTGGGRNLFSPEWTFNLGAEYTFDFAGFAITPRLNYSFVGEQYAYLGYNPDSDLIGDRGLLSALVTLEMDNYNIQVYANNLTDEEYVTGQGTETEYYGAPLQYGVRVGVDF